MILVGVLLTATGARSSPPLASVPLRSAVPDAAAAATPCAGLTYCQTLTITGAGQVAVAGPVTGTCSQSCQFGYNQFGCLKAISTAGCTPDLSLTESPSAGFVFAGWGGDCSGSSATCTLPGEQSHSVSATFVEPTLTISVTGPGTVSTTNMTCPPTCSQTYRAGVGVTLSESPSAGASFGGWGGSCSSAAKSTTCSLTMNANTSVSATFAAPTPPPPGQPTSRLTVQRTGSGSGSVTSNPGGISCGGTCTALFDSRTTVTLTPTAAAGSVFVGWGKVQCPGTTCQDVCPDAATIRANPSTDTTCRILPNSDKTVSADFEPETTPTQPQPPPTTAPVIGDASAPPEKPLYPPPANALAVSVAGNGSVVSSGHTTQSADGVATIQCGLAGFSCYATATPGATVSLRAKPGFGAVFKRWKGACAAAGATCQVALSASRSVTAVFAPAHGSALAATLARPTVHISWKQSVGRGTLLVSGRLTKPALLSVQLRRPHGGPLLTESTTVAAGRFTHVTRLFPGVLARGARLFPGGMMIVLTGRSGDLPLPFLLQTIVIPSPPEGVTRKVFASSSASSPPARSLPAGSTQAWAHFVFQNQPVRQRRLTVSWYWPNGRLLGTVVKANRPSLDSFLKSNVALPSGGWRAELRAGGKVVSELSIRIG